jgi:EpsI family protein
LAVRILTIAAIVGLCGVYAERLRSERVFSLQVPRLQSLPTTLKNWRGEDSPLSERSARSLGADALLMRSFRNEKGDQVWLFLAYFARQRANAQIHSPRNCLPGSGWHITAMEEAAIPLGQGAQPITRLAIERNGERQEVLYWFKTRSGSLTGEYALKIDLLKNSLARRPTDAAFIRFSAPLQASQSTRDLIQRLHGPIEDVFSEIGLK